MPNKELRRQIAFIWEQFWHAGVYDSAVILEQILYLLFLRRLDYQAPGAHGGVTRVCLDLEGGAPGPEEESLRWSAFRCLPDRAMFALLSDHVYPRLRAIGRPDPANALQLREVRLAIPNAAALAAIVRLLEKLPRSPGPGGADPFGYVAGKLARLGRRAGFPTPHAIGMAIWPDPCDLHLLALFTRTNCGVARRSYRVVGGPGLGAATPCRPRRAPAGRRRTVLRRYGVVGQPASGELRCERCVGSR
jgi:hypothetical protein